jgi:hypothetical protein
MTKDRFAHLECKLGLQDSRGDLQAVGSPTEQGWVTQPLHFFIRHSSSVIRHFTLFLIILIDKPYKGAYYLSKLRMGLFTADGTD